MPDATPTPRKVDIPALAASLKWRMNRRAQVVESICAGVPEGKALMGLSADEAEAARNLAGLAVSMRDSAEAHEQAMVAMHLSDPVMAASLDKACGGRIKKITLASPLSQE